MVKTNSEDPYENNLQTNGKNNEHSEKSDEVDELELKAVVDGEIIPIEEVKDPLFSNKVLGDGYGIIPTGKKIYSPIDGRIEKTASTHHAIYLSTPDNIKLLIHIGIDTVELKGEGFESNIEQGAKVSKGDVLIEFDPKFVVDEGYNSVVSVIILNSTDGDISTELIANKDKEVIGNQTAVLRTLIHKSN